MKKIIGLVFGILIGFWTVGYGQDKEIDNLKSKFENYADSILTYQVLPIFYNNPEKAKEFLIELEKQAKENESEIIIGKIGNFLGTWYKRHDNYSKAIIYLKTSINIFTKLNNNQQLSNAFNNIGLVYSRKKVYDSALIYYYQALKIREEFEFTDKIADIYNNIGGLYLKLSQYEKATEYFKLAYNYKIRSKNPRNYALAIENIGIAFHYQNNPDSSIAYYRKAKKVFKKLNNYYDLGRVANNIGSYFEKKQFYDSAVWYYKEAIKASEKLKEGNSSFHYLRNLAIVAIKFNKPNLAQKSILKCENLMSITSSLKNEYKLFLTKARLDSLNGNYINSINNFRIYFSQKEKINSEELKSTIAELETKYQTEKKEQENTLLKSKNQLKDQTIANQELVAFGVAGFGLVVLTFLGFIYQSSKKIKSQSKEILRKDKAHQRVYEALTHDLNRPLTSISASLSRAEKDISSNKANESQEKIKRAKLGVEILFHHTQKLLSWTRQNLKEFPYNPERFDAAEICNKKELSPYVDMAAERNHVISFDIKDNTNIYADKNAFTLIVNNILSNAIIHNPEHTQIAIKTYQNTDYVTITVEDEGSGIPNEVLNKIYSLDKKSKGTGIGFNLVHTLVMMNHGEIEIESEVGSGTKVIVKLPSNNERSSG